MTRLTTGALVVLCGWGLLASEARAQGEPSGSPGPKPQTHDGFYLRMNLGFGHMSTSATFLGASVKASGTALGLDFAFGGAVSENLVVFGELTFLDVETPTITVGSQSANGNGSLDHIGVGPGIAYYIMPANVYVSGAVIFGRLQTQANNSNNVSQTDLGMGLNLMVGKEFWVSREWGLGAVVQFMAANNHDPGIDSDYTTVGGTLGFSATFN